MARRHLTTAPNWLNPLVYRSGVLMTVIYLVINVSLLPTPRLLASLNQSASPLHPHIPGHLLVRPLENTPGAELQDVLQHLDASVQRNYPSLNNLQLWKLGPATTVREALTFCLESDLFELAEPDYILYSTTVPNDPSFSNGELWHLDNNGQTGGTRNADINAEEGWSIRSSAESIIVGVIDTGARYTHEDLRRNMWRNPNEIPGNGVDDDENGYIDDIHGINAIRDTGDPADDAGHGTHVAGTIGAVGNNGIGVSGVAWGVQIMPLRFLNRFGEGATSDAIQCISYAVDNGASIINTSWGTNAFSGSLNGAISLALQADVLIVAAAGNERRNNDVIPLYPASYNQNNVLSIAATTNRDQLANYSNYGAGSVDLAAPGNAILSTWGSSDRAYQTTSGTSMSTPMVTGAAALMRSHFPNASASEIADRLIATADPLPSLRGRCVSEGRLNLALSLGPDLIAGFTMSPNGGAPPLQVAFQDQSLGDVANWFWDFGDGQTTTGLPNPTHTYNQAGNFPVTLRIESTDGFSVSRTLGIPIVANYRVEFDFFNWITPESITQVRLEDDDVSNGIPLPFLFPFYARAHDEVYIGSNGVIGFAPDGLETAQNQSIPDGATPNALLCPYWDDLNPAQGGSITYGTTGTAPTRKFVVTWNRVPLKAASTLTLSFQAVLEESTQRVVFQYQEIRPTSNIGGGEGATIGLENHGGFLSAKYLFNGSRNLRNEQTIAFTPLSSNGMIVGPERDLLAVREQDGTTAMETQEFQLLNTGSQLIGWQASSDRDWILLSKTQGVLGAGQAEAVGARISPTASNLPPGSYFATIDFKNLSSGTGSVSRKIQLVINGEHSSWELAPQTSLAATGPQGGPFLPLSRIYTLINDGNRLINWTAEIEVDWVTMEPTQGILAAGVHESLSLRFAPIINNLQPGVHEAPITLEPEGEIPAPLRTTARVVVQGNASALVLLPDEPVLTLIPSSSGESPMLHSYEITNHGMRPGNWTLESNQTWLLVTPTQGTLEPTESQRIEVRPALDTEQLVEGDHQVQLTLVDRSNSNSTIATRELTIRIPAVQPPKLSATIEDGDFVIQFDGLAGATYRIEQSENLKTWAPLSTTETTASGQGRFKTPLDSSHERRFFRLTRIP